MFTFLCSSCLLAIEVGQFLPWTSTEAVSITWKVTELYKNGLKIQFFLLYLSDALVVIIIMIVAYWATFGTARHVSNLTFLDPSSQWLILVKGFTSNHWLTMYSYDNEVRGLATDIEMSAMRRGYTITDQFLGVQDGFTTDGHSH
jgi:hypothetical protein